MPASVNAMANLNAFYNALQETLLSSLTKPFHLAWLVLLQDPVLWNANKDNRLTAGDSSSSVNLLLTNIFNPIYSGAKGLQEKTPCSFSKKRLRRTLDIK